MEEKEEKAFHKSIYDILLRVSNVENRIGKLEEDMHEIVANLNGTFKDFRSDVKRIELKLLGDGSDEFGGRMGQLVKKQREIENFIVRIATIVSVIATVIPTIFFFLNFYMSYIR